MISLTVPAGVPLHVVLEKTVSINHTGVPVEAVVVDPVFVFDHKVIAIGSQVRGRVVKVESASRGRRSLAIANGNFSPIRKAQLAIGGFWLRGLRACAPRSNTTPSSSN